MYKLFKDTFISIKLMSLHLNFLLSALESNKSDMSVHCTNIIIFYLGTLLKSTRSNCNNDAFDHRANLIIVIC